MVALLQAAVEAKRVLEPGAAAALHGNAEDVCPLLWLQQLVLLIFAAAASVRETRAPARSMVAMVGW